MSDQPNEAKSMTKGATDSSVIVGRELPTLTETDAILSLKNRYTDAYTPIERRTKRLRFRTIRGGATVRITRPNQVYAASFGRGLM